MQSESHRGTSFPLSWPRTVTEEKGMKRCIWIRRMTLCQHSGNNQALAIPVPQLGMLCTVWMSELIRDVWKWVLIDSTAVPAPRSKQVLQPTPNELQVLQLQHSLFLMRLLHSYSVQVPGSYKAWQAPGQLFTSERRRGGLKGELRKCITRPKGP